MAGNLKASGFDGDSDLTRSGHIRWFEVDCNLNANVSWSPGVREVPGPGGREAAGAVTVTVEGRGGPHGPWSAALSALWTQCSWPARLGGARPDNDLI